MVKAKRYVIVKAYNGLPAKENFKLIEEELPPLKNGEYLVEAIYLSVDPYMGMYGFTIGETMIGTSVGKIIESKSKKFPVGKYVDGHFGWRTHAIVHEDYKSSIGWDHPALTPFEPTAKLPLSLTLGVLIRHARVGGEISSTVIHQMKIYGRIAVCGCISNHGQKNPKITDFYWHFLINRLEMKAFVIADYAHRCNESISANLKWIQEGKLKFKEAVTEGFENMPNALIGLYFGENIGKAIVKV